MRCSMSKIEYRVCDRCKRKLGDIRYEIVGPRWVRLMRRTPSAFDYSDSDYELCSDCADAVVRLLRRPPEEGV